LRAGTLAAKKIGSNGISLLLPFAFADAFIRKENSWTSRNTQFFAWGQPRGGDVWCSRLESPAVARIQPEIDYPNFNRIYAAHFRPPSGRASVPPPVLPDCRDSHRSLDSRFPAALREQLAAQLRSVSEFLDDFRCAHGESIIPLGDLSVRKAIQNFFQWEGSSSKARRMN